MCPSKTTTTPINRNSPGNRLADALKQLLPRNLGLALTLVFGFVLLLSVKAYAGSNAATEASPKLAEPIAPVRFASSSIEPWGIKTAGVDQGLLVSVIEALELETGISITNELQPYPRVVHSLYSGYVDFAFLFDSPSTRASATRVGHLINSRMIVVGLPGAPAMTSLTALKDLSVGLIRGSKYGPEFDEGTHFKVVQVSTMEQGLAMLLRERIDVMVGTDQSVFWAMKKMNLGARRLSKLFVLGGTTGSLYMSNYSERRALIPVFKQALEKIHEDGTMSEIFDEKYEWAN